jgi:hypothetical protein
MQSVCRLVLTLAATNVFCGSLASAQAAGGFCNGGGGGGFSVEGTSFTFSLASDSAGGRLLAGILVRAPASWLARHSKSDEPPFARLVKDSPRASAGGSVGPMWVIHDVEARRVWLDDAAIALGDANILLVSVDSMKGWRCDYPASADEWRAFEAALGEVLRRSAMVRSFLAEKAR